MKPLRRFFIKRSTREIVDNVMSHSGYPQTENGLKQLNFSEDDIKRAINSMYLEEYDFPVASFGDGQDIAYVALKLTDKAKKIALTGKGNTEVYSKLFWWLMGLVSTIVGGLILAYGFGVGR